ncbi:cobalt-precorrin-6A reductase [Antrihabitans cavernicola]|uniref:cobalt-precorrin-6A reductase n=1 Tax=Antrihabitans cavernicola TaxID=2495913 RepID=UPI001BE4441E|nr:cobalt-precorrin-6A reductase [Spelaeibacter cavernicola]
MRALILGGTGEARSLATTLAGERGLEIVSSLAGRVRAPQLPPGEVRIGGFGGTAGLQEWLRDNAIDVVVDATHPFAAQVTQHSVDAAAELGLPIVVLRRSPWIEDAGDRWAHVPSVAAAVDALPGLGTRVFSTIGRQSVAAFVDAADIWFLIRAIDPPDGPLPPNAELLLERGPFDVQHEAELLDRHRIDLLLTKNSGGDQTVAKLSAARAAGVRVLMIDRPPLPAGVETVESVAAAHEWLRRLLAS